MQKGLKEWDTDSEKPTKKALIEKIAGAKADDLYLLAFNRWLNCTFDNDEFVHLSAKVNGRLFTGLALGGALETGAMIHHTYGMPMIAGSSIKGAVRAYAEYIFAKRKIVDNQEVIDYRIEIKQGKEIKHFQFDEDKQAILNVLFGTESDDDNAEAGYLIWHDAWWIPNVDKKGRLTQSNNCPFVGEIVTVHHQDYYQGKLDEALDIESPIPNQQIAMIGSFYFSIQGDKAWADYALDLLKGALQYQGLGAKGSNGYGYFDNIDGLESELKKRYNANKPVRDDIDPITAKIIQKARGISEKDLPLQLSKKKNGFFNDLELDKNNPDDCKKVAQVFIEEYSDIITQWADAPTGSNLATAYQFIEQYR
ncbi:type III-B CRISPR module RAMP protein Cmr6 [Alysiella filiformis]|nr:type III-B CRISPR module RAMP protein Cmr6 [Alysiella filiformis]